MHRTIISTTVALAMALLSPAVALAQDAGSDPEAVPHPSHIHVGLCPTPGDIVAPLSDVTAMVGETKGPDAGIPVESATTTIGLALTDMLASEHAVVIHRAHDEMATLIACGGIGGPVSSGTDLVLGLRPVGDSSYSGIAMLTDNGDGTTTVEVFIARFGAAAAAEPVAG